MKVYFVFFFIFSIYNKCAHADEIQNLLSRVRDLRLEVESINKDINSQRELNQSYIQTQSIRKAELESEIQKSIEVKQNLIVEDKKIKKEEFYIKGINKRTDNNPTKIKYNLDGKIESFEI